MIRKIDARSVHSLCSGQVMLDLTSVVKELVENAIDAGSKTIEVKFKDFGSSMVEVIDDGLGIDEENFESIALRYHTSKIRSFEDLSRISSLGFRGEALSSLCAIANLSITTSTNEMSPKGYKLSFDTMGNLNSKLIVARSVGTSIKVSEMFKGFPVRMKDFHKNIKKFFNKSVALIQTYAIIQKGVRIKVTNFDMKGKLSVLFQTGSGGDIKSNFGMLYGPACVNNLLSFEIDLSELNSNNNDNDDNFKFVGLISKPNSGCGRSSGDRQFYYINSRPCNLSRITKIMNECYKSSNLLQFPMVVGNLILPTDYYDVNLTPDKRTIMLHKETEIINLLKSKMMDFLDKAKATVQLNLINRVTNNNTKSKVVDGVGLPKASLRDVSDLKPSSQSKEDVIDSILNNNDSSTSNISNFEQSLTQKSLPLPIALDEDLVKNAPDILIKPFDKEINPISNTTLTENSSFNNNISSTAILTQKLINEIEESQKNSHISSTPLSNQNNSFLQHLQQNGFSQSFNQPSQFKNISKQPLQSSSQNDKSIKSNKLNSFINNSTILDHFKPINTQSDNSITLNQNQFTFRSNPNDASSDNQIPNKLVKLEDNLDNANTNDDVMAVDGIIPYDPNSYVHVESPSDDEVFEEFTNVKYPAIETGLSLSWSMDSLEQYLTSSPTDIKDLEIDTSFGMLTNQNQECAETNLTMTLDPKVDFPAMQVIGQFNRGFIIALLNNTELFIIDQHAADEIYNYTQLHHSIDSNLPRQPLVMPKKLYLSVQDEMVALDHLDYLKSQGFHLKKDDDSTPGNRLTLMTVPAAKQVQFDNSDLDQLIHHLSHHQPINQSASISQLANPTRIIQSETGLAYKGGKLDSKLASIACRKSIMIGQALNLNVMKKILLNLSTLPLPWNCPHGRPTLRHLGTLSYNDHME